MNKIIVFFFIIFLANCSKPQTVTICGDHVCVNKAEAKKYFEENLSIEIRVLDSKKKKEISLVELNLKENSPHQKKVFISTKNKTNKKIKKLSKDEIKQIKSAMKKEKKIDNVAKINLKKNQKVLKTEKIINNKDPLNKTSQKKLENNSTIIVDVCTIVDKCTIDKISKYLIKQSKDRKFPDITLRENRM